jgi:hypothetical protein
MDQQKIIEELRERIARLEDRPRRILNLHQAAARRGMSVSKFRERHRAGLEPQGRLVGRIWQFTTDELDAQTLEGDKPASGPAAVKRRRGSR